MSGTTTRKPTALATHYHAPFGSSEKLQPQPVDITTQMVMNTTAVSSGRNASQTVYEKLEKAASGSKATQDLQASLNTFMKNLVKAKKIRANQCSVAIADLRGRNKYSPVMAGWNYAMPCHAASTGKAVAAFVCCQLLQDMAQITSTADFVSLSKTEKFRKWAASVKKQDEAWLKQRLRRRGEPTGKTVTRRSLPELEAIARKFWDQDPLPASQMSGREPLIWTPKQTSGGGTRRHGHRGKLRFMPDISWFFTFEAASGIYAPRFSSMALYNLYRLHDNKHISANMSRMGYQYMASVLVQAGLAVEGYDPRATDTRDWDRHGGGIWFHEDYDTNPWWVENKSDKTIRYSEQPINLTAWSAIWFLTLLAQDRLVSPVISKFLFQRLKKQCLTSRPASPGSFFPSQKLRKLVVATKCGQANGWYNDAVILEEPKGQRFAITCLSKGISGTVYRQIIEHAYGLIKAAKYPT